MPATTLLSAAGGVQAPVPSLSSDALVVFLLQVSLLLAVALLLGRLAIRFGLPALVGELVAGLLLGPSMLHHLVPPVSDWLFPRRVDGFALLDAVGQLGVLLLVGVAGMQMDLGMVRRQGRTALNVSLAGLVVPFGLGVALGYLLPSGGLIPAGTDRGVFALFLGVAMSVSALPVIAKTLADLNLLHRKIGQLTLSAAMVDDLFGWLMLSFVSALALTGAGLANITRSVLWLLVLLLVARFAGRPVVRALLRRAGRAAGGEASIALVVVVVLAGASATAAMGLEAVFGAFIAGMVISSTGQADPVRLAPLRTVVFAALAPIFFATAGLRVDLSALADPAVLLAGLAVLLIAVLGKFVGAYLGARLSRLTRWEALCLGAGMNSRGVVEVVVATVGLKIGVLTAQTYTIVLLVAVVTSLMAPPILRYGFARIPQEPSEQPVPEPAGVAGGQR